MKCYRVTLENGATHFFRTAKFAVLFIAITPERRGRVDFNPLGW